jgi:hypothetical protein
MVPTGFSVGSVCAWLIPEQPSTNPTKPTRKLGNLTGLGDIILVLINKVRYMKFEVLRKIRMKIME